MALLNYIISAVFFGFLIFIVGLAFIFIYNNYSRLLKPLLMKFKFYQNKQLNFWVDIVINCLANDYKDQEIVNLLSSNNLTKEQIETILSLATDKMDNQNKMKGGVKQ